MQRYRLPAGWLACMLLLFSLFSAAGEGSVAWVDPPSEIRPGTDIRLSFSSTHAGKADIIVKSDTGATVAVLAEGFPAKAGRNNLSWDGTASGEALKEGAYTLIVSQDTQISKAGFTVGDVSPAILSATPSSKELIIGQQWHIDLNINVASTLTMKLIKPSGEAILYESALPAGKSEISWDGMAGGEALAPGSYTIGLSLTDETGYTSKVDLYTIVIKEALSLPIPEETAVDTIPNPIETTIDSKIENKSPSDFSSHTCEHESCFFKLPMGVMDEAAIWEAMMQPMTVVKGEQRNVVKVYKEPNKDSQAIGEVTATSQGLHVLKTLDNGWTLVEAYSSSIYNSKVKNWAGFFTGYIETNKLETKQPNQNYGLLMDKLTQRMYVFQDGKIITELLISTGLPNSKQPYNETPAGEFMIVSWTGGFWSGNMWCDMALRINGGILIHEVPCLIGADGTTRNYAPFERALGQKASHGCIRVQQEKNADGINMRWLWDNLKRNSRVFIWDDVGRNIPIPDAELPVYYNPDGGQYYHSDENCDSVKSRYLPLTGFTYGELEDETYKKLTPCSYCNPPMREAAIQALNEGKR